MSRHTFLPTLAFAAALVALPPVNAHHSAAMFDRNEARTLSGTVKRFDFVNPHSWLYVDVNNDDGSVTEWGFELDSPSILRRRGVGPAFWESGDSITVKTNPLIDGRPAGLLVGAVAANGKTFGNTTGVEP